MLSLVLSLSYFDNRFLQLHKACLYVSTGLVIWRADNLTISGSRLSLQCS